MLSWGNLVFITILLQENKTGMPIFRRNWNKPNYCGGVKVLKLDTFGKTRWLRGFRLFRGCRVCRGLGFRVYCSSDDAGRGL